ncbi:cytochrome P450 [Aspergillus taichungensis]|uniref:Cytochrome P450 n=1 Tax=Aspergillus taichungensis TaxID=482145 RepID=A0A2J5HGP8_9EURO|nr:cytochrome P450 [Aspergillus taichungensis]
MPPVAPYWIPYFGHVFEFFRDPGKLVQNLRKKYPGVPFSLVMMGTKFHVFDSVESASTIFSRSRDFDFSPIVASMMQNGLDLPDQDTQIYQGTFRSAKGSKPFQDLVHNAYIRFLTGKHLDSIMKVYRVNLVHYMNENFQLPGTEKRNIFVFEEMRRLVFATSVTTFFGTRIQKDYPGFWEDFRRVDDTLYAGVRSNLPFRLSRQAWQARERILLAFDRWIDTAVQEWPGVDEIWCEEWGLKLNWERERLHRDNGITSRGRSCAHLSFLWVSMTNVGPLATTFLMNLLESPIYKEQFQSKAESAVTGYSGNMSDFDLTKLKLDPWVQGFWKETIRLGSTSASARVLQKDEQLEGFTLHKGSLVFLPVQLMHYNPDVFEDPTKFDPNRWIGGEDKRQNSSLRPFGGGSSICSGRFLAEQETLLIAAIFLLRFDIKIKSPQKPFKRNPRALGIMGPLRDIELELRPRTGGI